MLSRRRSQFFSRKGSMLRDRLSKLGVKVEDLEKGLDSRALREGGRSVGPEVLGHCSWWMKVVIRCELWISTGSSSKISW
jgi:hypothetical protein